MSPLSRARSHEPILMNLTLMNLTLMSLLS